MGDFRVGWEYPPSIKLGITNVKRVMCGNEQVWPHNNGIMLHFGRSEYVDGVSYEDEYYLTLQKGVIPPSVEGVYTVEEWRDGTYAIYVKSFTGTATGVSADIEHDDQYWDYEWYDYGNSYAIVVHPELFDQTEYMLNRVYMTFEHDYHNVEIFVESDAPLYGCSTSITVNPDGSYSGGGEGDFSAKPNGSFGNVRVQCNYNYAAYPFTRIEVDGFEDNEYVITYTDDTAYVDLNREAFLKFHESTHIKWVYEADRTAYVNFTEHFIRSDAYEYVDSYHGHVRYNANTRKTDCWFDKNSPAGKYTAVRDGDYMSVNLMVPEAKPDGTYYTIENFSNHSSVPYRISIVTDENGRNVGIRIPFEYIQNPALPDSIDLEWNLVEHTP